MNQILRDAQKIVFKVKDVDTHQNRRCCLTHFRLMFPVIWNQCVANVPMLIWTSNQNVINFSILYISIITEDLCFSGVFRGYKLGRMDRNGLEANN